MTVRLAIKLTPRAAKDQIDGWDLDVDGRPILKVRVRAQPIEGEANEALCALMARRLKIPRRNLTLIRGGQSRLKMLEVAGISDTEMRDLLNNGG